MEQRVIRTELYFDSSEIGFLGGDNIHNPGIAFAFFGGLTNGFLEIEGLEEFQAGKIFDNFRIIHSNESQLTTLGVALDVFLEGGSLPDFNERLASGEIRKKKVIEYILSENIVTESSPPEWLPIKNIVNGTPMVIGTFIGFAMSKDNPTLMLITVPAGIVVVGAAAGISEGLKRGLNKLIGDVLTSFSPNESE